MTKYAIEFPINSNFQYRYNFLHFHSIKFSNTNDLHNPSNLFIPIKLISQNFPSLIIQKKKRIIIHSTTRIITHVSLSSKKKKKRKGRPIIKTGSVHWRIVHGPVPRRSSATAAHSRLPAVFAVRRISGRNCFRAHFCRRQACKLGLRRRDTLVVGNNDIMTWWKMSARGR